MDIGKNIKRIRTKKGLTQLQAAKLCGMLEPQYRRYENGKSNPRASTVERIASALNVPGAILPGMWKCRIHGEPRRK